MSRPGALLMTYGSPTTLEPADVATYLARVRGGREPDDELVTEFTRRYRVIGGSPLIPRTREQAAALEGALGWPVAVGMRFSEPSIEAGIRELAARGVDEVAAIILSPQSSELLMGGYTRAVASALEAIGPGAPEARVASAWYHEPAFVEAVAERIHDALAGDTTTPVLLTAHSLPRKVAEAEPTYLDQLRETAESIARAAGLPDARWRFCWQSAGHEPGEWMTPDFADLMPELAAAGHRSVVVAPIQFLSDHLEVLYDVDIGAREQAERQGLAFRRIQSLGTHPRFVAGLARVAERTLVRLATVIG